LEYVKSPLNYTGNKFNLLPQILPIFPKEINTFYDIFGGSGTVGININANKVVYNEYNKFVFELVEYIGTCDVDRELKEIDNIIKEYGLGKNTKDEYYYFRDNVYNINPNPRMLFILSCFSLNYQLRFNSKGKFNMTCGNRSFSDDMRKRFIEFNEKAKVMNIRFLNHSFNELKVEKLKSDDFIYLDPPYLLTVTSYTENGAWNPDKEQKMYDFIDELDRHNIKFALSNVLIYRGVENNMLNQWSKKYIVNNLDYTYKNNNCWQKDNTVKTQEVLITNY
jgi:DNA adenine methylase Dam